MSKWRNTPALAKREGIDVVFSGDNRCLITTVLRLQQVRAAVPKAADNFAVRGLEARTFFPLGGAKDFNQALQEQEGLGV